MEGVRGVPAQGVAGVGVERGARRRHGAPRRRRERNGLRGISGDGPEDGSGDGGGLGADDG